MTPKLFFSQQEDFGITQPNLPWRPLPRLSRHQVGPPQSLPFRTLWTSSPMLFLHKMPIITEPVRRKWRTRATTLKKYLPIPYLQRIISLNGARAHSTPWKYTLLLTVSGWGHAIPTQLRKNQYYIKQMIFIFMVCLVCLSVSVCVCLSLYMYMSVSMCVCVCLSVSFYMCLSVSMCFYLYVSMSMCP